MIKTEAQERKTNEELFYQYLKGIEHNALIDRIRAWHNFKESATDVTDPDAVNAYIKFARAAEKLTIIEKIVEVYNDQVRGGMTT